MDVIHLFEFACEGIAAEPSRKIKGALATQPLLLPEIRELFAIALSPYWAFYEEFPYDDQPSEYTSIEQVREFALARNRREPHKPDEPRLGKWLTRAFNKTLGIGLGAGTINKLYPGSVMDLQIVEPDEVNFTAGETWAQMIHHLEEPKSWLITPDPQGIRCLMRVHGQKIFPMPATGCIRCVEVLENDFALLPPMHDVLLDGRLCLKDAATTQEIYDAYALANPPPEIQDRMHYVVLDKVDPDLMLEERLEWLKKHLGDLNKHVHLMLPQTEPINYLEDEQCKSMRLCNYPRAWLRHGKKLYIPGKSRDHLIIKI